MVKLEKAWAPLLSGVGAVNWGLTEFVGFNAVEFVSFGVGAIALVLYGAVTIAGAVTLYQLFR